MKKTLKKISSNGVNYTLLNLPNTEIFKYEVVQWIGGNIERLFKEFDPNNEKELFGVSHLIEHMCFKESLDYSTEEIKDLIKDFGECNASTDHERVNFFYKGTMSHMKEIVNLVNNISFNDLKRVSREDFETERKVVLNEANIYYDDDHTKFFFDETSQTFGLDFRDNVIGSIETINGLELSDLINVKSIMNLKENQTINVVYDGTLISEEDLIRHIETNLSKFNLESDPNAVRIYRDNLPRMINQTTTIPTEADQSLYSFTFEMDGFNRVNIMKALDFLNDFSRHSLTEEVREKRGLTYHIGSGNARMGGRDYFQIYCNITKGTESELILGISEAFEKSIPELTEENFEKFKNIMKTKRKIGFLDLNKYMNYVWEVNENTDFYERYRDILEMDVDMLFGHLDEDFTLEEARGVLESAKTKFLNKDGSEVWGVKGCED